MTKYAQQILDLVLCSTEHPTATTTPRATIT